MARAWEGVSGDLPLPLGAILLRISSLVTAGLPSMAEHRCFPSTRADRDMLHVVGWSQEVDVPMLSQVAREEARS